MDRPVLRSQTWIIAGGVVAVLVLVLSLVGVDRPAAAATVGVLTVGFGVSVLGWALVRSRRQRVAYEEELTVWAAERAVQAERLRIARDLHDIASHGLGAMTVRAAAARTAQGGAADAERVQALSDIERAGRAATTELRRMLTVLRTSGDEDVPFRPVDTFGDLPRILEAARLGRVDAVLDIDGVGGASASTQLTICTIVREALANVARHAGPTTARVGVRRAGAAVVVTVQDDGPVPGWRPHAGSGRGLAGLRERVDACGGTMAAGPVGRGFGLTATVPDGLA